MSTENLYIESTVSDPPQYRSRLDANMAALCIAEEAFAIQDAGRTYPYSSNREGGMFYGPPDYGPDRLVNLQSKFMRINPVSQLALRQRSKNSAPQDYQLLNDEATEESEDQNGLRRSVHTGRVVATIPVIGKTIDHDSIRQDITDELALNYDNSIVRRLTLLKAAFEYNYQLI